ncbi:unnamed protein product [Pseudo-nitzschia multistriata]|uniref:Uncharacterized protein n=1 Tax=Pseudo-nitzschia multistriata TaxID=183589 RepID=A0A448Z0M6_9STRA|nr:unnamed protein product [Pseudo-nitzschia multistriata]
MRPTRPSIDSGSSGCGSSFSPASASAATSPTPSTNSTRSLSARQLIPALPSNIFSLSTQRESHQESPTGQHPQQSLSPMPTSPHGCPFAVPGELSRFPKDDSLWGTDAHNTVMGTRSHSRSHTQSHSHSWPLVKRSTASLITEALDILQEGFPEGFSDCEDHGVYLAVVGNSQ